ncbi:MAG: RluA family pseudouridine synthase [Anaerolineae bacterium]|nr:RluA family pseudouridine synthase [Phycisphaerae bacterium]
MTLLDFLIAKYPTAKRQTLRRMLDDGRVRVNGIRPRSMKLEVKDSDDVRVNERATPASSRTAPPRPLPFTIIHEDEDILVIDKPAGLLTSTVPNESRPTVLAAVMEYFSSDPNIRFGLIHRLDRDASGLLVFSKNAAAYEALKRQFFEHTVERVYHAVIDGALKPPAGRIESDLVERTNGTVFSSTRKSGGEHAITDYKTVRRAGTLSLVRVTLHTGRKHQIRVHLSERGRPIINDPIYSDRPRTGQMMLAATELAFDHPQTAKRVKFELPLPREMATIMRD